MRRPPGWVPLGVGCLVAFLVLFGYLQQQHVQDRSDFQRLERTLSSEQRDRRAAAARASAREEENAARIAALQQGLAQANADLAARGQPTIVIAPPPATSPTPTPTPAPSGNGSGNGGSSPGILKQTCRAITLGIFCK